MSQTVLQSIDTPERAGEFLYLPVAALTSLYAGTLIALNSSGFATYATDGAGLEVVGRAEYWRTPGITHDDGVVFFRFCKPGYFSGVSHGQNLPVFVVEMAGMISKKSHFFKKRQNQIFGEMEINLFLIRRKPGKRSLTPAGSFAGGCFNPMFRAENFDAERKCISIPALENHSKKSHNITPDPYVRSTVG